MEISKSLEQGSNTNNNSSMIKDISKSNGKMLIWILILTILSFMVLVVIRCLVEYRKYKKSFKEVKKEERLISISRTRLAIKHPELKEELKMAVRRRNQRLQQSGDDESESDESTTEPASEVSSYNGPSYSRPRHPLTSTPRPGRVVTRSDVDLDAIEEAPAPLGIFQV